MGLKSAIYQPNSIIYFVGDVSDRVFILKSGAVMLTGESLETGKEIKSLVQVGEFFGAQSALGNYLRDETAMVLKESEIIIFSVPELESFLMENSRINFKMLNVFSQQLRKIHKQVQKLLTNDIATDQEYGLFRIGEYYLKNKNFTQAEGALKRYLIYYPQGRYADEAAAKIQQAEQGASRSSRITVDRVDQSANNVMPRTAPDRTSDEPVSAPEGESKTKYLEGLGLFKKQKYEEAYKVFYSVVTENTDPDNLVKAELDLGRTLIELNKHKEAVQQLTGFIKKYPRHPDMKSALYYIGLSYEKSGTKDKAAAYYKKVFSMLTPSDKLYASLEKAVARTEG